MIHNFASYKNLEENLSVNIFCACSVELEIQILKLHILITYKFQKRKLGYFTLLYFFFCNNPTQ